MNSIIGAANARNDPSRADVKMPEASPYRTFIAITFRSEDSPPRSFAAMFSGIADMTATIIHQIISVNINRIKILGNKNILFD